MINSTYHVQLVSSVELGHIASTDGFVYSCVQTAAENLDSDYVFPLMSHKSGVF